MAMFVRKGKWQEWQNLCADVRAARDALNGAMAGITIQCKEYNLDKPNPGTICINRFDCVRADTLSADVLDDNGAVKFCEKFDCHHLCENNDCPNQESNWDAVAAQFAYDAARRARRDFLRGLFRIQRKGR